MSDAFLRAGQAICRPATKLMEKHHQRKVEIEEGLRRDKPPPHPLKRRKRALTWQTSKAVQSQDQSPLLAKLPLELRQLIWIECVGGMTVHLKIWDRRLRGVCCRCPGMPWCKHLRHFKTPHDELGPLDLLLTCHQVYSEAIEFLYSQNMFKILNEDCLSYLPQLLLPQRINAIRYIRFEWFLKHAPDAETHQSKKDAAHNFVIWKTVWQNLASMQGLEHLWIELDIDKTWKHEWMEQQSTVFEPVKAVTRPKYFKLIIPFREDLEQARLAELPCQVRRPDEDQPDRFEPYVVASCT
ncbi:hypothetical protein ABVK25_005206 [Lepraria finkii]|uniref:DUF7730 domain-containing protein n=1 Tax=Lepraria finkii TaxID=1340010 RepID=A0ABR4BEZ6_9LECA